MGIQTTLSVESEAARLLASRGRLKYSREQCAQLAELTLEINRLKKEKNAVILAHNYQTADIIYGVADYVGDSLYLSRKARESDADVIVFCGVRFMAETAKMLSPQKKVLLPDLKAGCSLAEGISAADVWALKIKHPGAPVVCYINSYAETKAESDAVCTSGNALKVIESFPEQEIIFIPDQFMAANLQKETKKKLISHNALCIVHETFTAHQIASFKKLYPQAQTMAHIECSPEVAALADYVGSTGKMADFVDKSLAKQFMVVTECGMGDLLRVQFPDREFIVPCAMCPYMKRITLEGVLRALLKGEHEIKVDESVRRKAMNALDRMLSVG
ncbi:MAG: quinolinate synthase NadA [Candidatus Diapherotrites archaeon]|nr:quinolinate synthase NadA [Candidatus Diapherotrites archaeon]